MLKYIVLLIMYSTSLLCQTKHLVQPGFDWHEPTAWSPQGVPTANDSVIIGGYTFIKPDSTARAKYLEITNIGNLEIQRDLMSGIPGRLRINDAITVALLNRGILSNGGRITLSGSTGSGIINHGHIETLDRSVLTIRDCSATGLFSYATATVVHDGSLIIEDCGTGVSGSPLSFYIDEDGRLEAYSSQNSGINLSNSYLTNHGVILIDSAGDYGVNNSAVIHNHDSIIISNVYELLAAISNSDSIFNHNTGAIILHDCEHDGILNNGYLQNLGYIEMVNMSPYGIVNWDSLDNIGNIQMDTIEEAGIYTTGSINNEGHIKIDNTQIGVSVLNEGSFNNQDTLLISDAMGNGIYNAHLVSNEGYISIYDCRAAAASGIYNATDAEIYNEGKIEINNIEAGGLLNAGLFTNQDSLIIERVYHFALGNYDSLYNSPMGLIDISIVNTGAPAMANYGGHIVNDGKIEVYNCEGAGMTNIGTITNNDSLVLYSLVSAGIANSLEFYNQGFLVISGIRGNLEPDNFKIDSYKNNIADNETVAFANLTIDPGIQSVMTNSGEIFIQYADIGIYNASTFENAGDINVTDISGYSIEQEETSDSTAVVFDNQGMIYSESDDGMLLRSGSSFYVGVSGSLTGLSTDDDMLDIQHGAIFECLGTLEFEDYIVSPLVPRIYNLPQKR